MKQLEQEQRVVLVLNRLAEHYGYQDWWEDDNRLADWVSMILIQQTTEQNAKKALENLAGFLTAQQLQAMPLEELQERIRPAGFFKQKSNYIKTLMTWYIAHGEDLEQFKSYDTQQLRKELLAIKGVGPETADAMLLYIFERNVFICDQYVMRLFARLGLGEYKTYQAMRQAVSHFVEDISHKQCKEWHAAIDVHGKHFGKNPQLDERWLLE